MTEIDRLEFSEKGFEELKCEVQVLIELVTEMAGLLTPEQKAAINEHQNSRHMSQADFNEFIKTRGKEPVGTTERIVRIRRLLKT